MFVNVIECVSEYVSVCVCMFVYCASKCVCVCE